MHIECHLNFFKVTDSNRTLFHNTLTTNMCHLIHKHNLASEMDLDPPPQVKGLQKGGITRMAILMPIYSFQLFSLALFCHF